MERSTATPCEGSKWSRPAVDFEAGALSITCKLKDSVPVADTIAVTRAVMRAVEKEGEPRADANHICS